MDILSFSLFQESCYLGNQFLLVPHQQMAAVRVSDEPRVRNVLGGIVGGVKSSVEGAPAEAPKIAARGIFSASATFGAPFGVARM